MELKITEEKQNELFGRAEVKVEIESKVTPSESEVLESLAGKFKVPKEAIKVKGIYGKFGTHVFEIIANVYSSIEDKEKVEVKTKQEKEAIKKAEEERLKAEAEEREAKKKAEEEAKAEAEKPVEEKKEEPKEEEKPGEVKEEEKK